MKTGALGLGAIAVAIASPAAAQDAYDAPASTGSEFSLTTGVDYSSGDYGTGIDTDILVVPVSARLKTGDWRFTASVPYLRINGANIVGGDGGPIVIDPNAPRGVREGIGDVTLGATYAIPEDRLGFGLELSGRVKLPTASQAKGLGTGKTDFAVAADVSKTFGTVTPFVTAGYRFPGDPDTYDLRNTFYGSAGASVAMGKSVLLASYDYRQSASALAEDSQEVFGAFSAPLSGALGLTLYGSAGLSDGAPDYGVGAMLTIKAF